MKKLTPNVVNAKDRFQNRNLTLSNFNTSTFHINSGLEAGLQFCNDYTSLYLTETNPSKQFKNMLEIFMLGLHKNMLSNKNEILYPFYKNTDNIKKQVNYTEEEKILWDIATSVMQKKNIKIENRNHLIKIIGNFYIETTISSIRGDIQGFFKNAYEQGPIIELASEKYISLKEAFQEICNPQNYSKKIRFELLTENQDPNRKYEVEFI